MNPWPEHRDDLVISALKNKLNFIASKKANRLCKYFENVARDRSVSSEMSHRHWEGMNSGCFRGQRASNVLLMCKGPGQNESTSLQRFFGFSCAGTDDAFSSAPAQVKDKLERG